MKVYQMYGHRVIPGEVGIEIELEGEGVTGIVAGGWKSEHDGSLRGEAVELVLRKPIARDKVHEYVSRIQESVQQIGAKPVDTGRAGVHLHINVQELTLEQLFNFICAYIIFEIPLIRFCGEHRVGNLFCLRVQDAEYLLQSISRSIKEFDFWNYKDNIRYAAMNLTSLSRYGSLEFRAMRSTIDPDCIHKWMTLITKIKDWSMRFDNPQQIIQEFSIQGPDAVFEFLRQEGLESSPEELYEGVRYAQEIAFSSDWDISVREKLMEAKEELPRNHPYLEIIDRELRRTDEELEELSPRLAAAFQLMRNEARKGIYRDPFLMRKPRRIAIDEGIELDVEFNEEDDD